MPSKEEPRSQWQDAEERWQAQVRYWAVLDRGGYLEAVRADLDGPSPRHEIWNAR